MRDLLLHSRRRLLAALSDDRSVKPMLRTTPDSLARIDPFFAHLTKAQTHICFVASI
jgi:hypothetical protein